MTFPQIIHKRVRNLTKGKVWEETFPKDVKILSVGVQDEKAPELSIWYSFRAAKFPVDESRDRTFTFTALETGKPYMIDWSWTFLGTAILLGGQYVSHVYYKENP